MDDEKNLGCYYCDAPNVVSPRELPCKCPMCSQALLKSWDTMTQEEKMQAIIRKAVLRTTGPTYTLAG